MCDQMIDKRRITSDHIESLEPNEVFVFGSNLQGSHGGGAACAAFNNFGAVWGQGVGMQGQSYAIPTMQGGVETIAPYVDEFIEYAKNHPEKQFLVTEIGCGIAGFIPYEIAPLFKKAVEIDNISLPRRFWSILIPKSDPRDFMLQQREYLQKKERPTVEEIRQQLEEHKKQRMEKMK